MHSRLRLGDSGTRVRTRIGKFPSRDLEARSTPGIDSDLDRGFTKPGIDLNGPTNQFDKLEYQSMAHEAGDLLTYHNGAHPVHSDLINNAKILKVVLPTSTDGEVPKIDPLEQELAKVVCGKETAS